MNSKPKKKKVVILGGGIGAMTAAFELTNSEELRAKYDVTVYQLGWRLGGKGASGRKQVDGAERIEEHGLHILMGCYENAFHLLRQCYEELDRPHGTPLRTIKNAFEPHSQVVAEQYFKEEWHQWHFDFPEDKDWLGRVKYPGKRDKLPGFFTYIKRILQWLASAFADADHKLKELATGLAANDQSHSWWHDLHQEIQDHMHVYLEELEDLAIDIEGGTAAVETGEKHDYIYRKLIELRDEKRRKLSSSIDLSLDLLRLWIGIDLSLTYLIGIFKYNLFFNSYNTINGFDFREWLADCGGTQELIDSPLITVLYELVFAYEGGRAVGDDVVPNIEAGAIMRALPHMVFGYTGAFMWKMQSSMGDTIFAPMYLVLKKRGVTFKFFHKVLKLHVQADEVVSIDISPQVNLNVAEYDPFRWVKVEGYEHPLPAWPSEPRYEQIVEGDKLKVFNLESFYTTWVDTGKPVQLKAGEDFHYAILGISLGSFPYICEELIQTNSKWQRMVKHVKTVQTQAAQFWMQPFFDDLGFTVPGAVVGAFTPSQLDTWADMTYLLEGEGWPPELVKSLAYFTGPMQGPEQAPPPSDTQFPQKSKKQNEAVVEKLLAKQIKILWPNYQGTAQIVSSYLRYNIDPSERYVMSVKNSSQHRLKAGDSGFKNLMLAGDWTDCTINMGCVEAATISGMQASQKISGFPKKVVLYQNRII
jgi:uncharacterized protein with NAD-binding domain and iron-sulfur cluster